MDAQKYVYQSEFARRYVAEGTAKGNAEGRMVLILRLLELRFGEVSERHRARIRQASLHQLDAIAEQLLFANSVEEALGT
jgi:hypothetical protein